MRRFGPRVQDPPLWSAMNPSPPVNSKKKKKQEVKPQNQLSKCLNEKRRREQENNIFEELEGLIQASFVDDMNAHSVKLDKCTILEQTVSQLQCIKAEFAEEEAAVQQGEISSSRPSIISKKLLDPLLEAFDGFLFIVSTEGKIDFVAPRVYLYLKFKAEELTGEDIYDYIHSGDRDKFLSAFASVGDFSSKTETSRSKIKIFTCRFLVKQVDAENCISSEELLQNSYYERMQVIAFVRPYPDDNSDSTEEYDKKCLYCIVRLPPSNDPLNPPVAQFTTKLDCQGKILDIDTSGISVKNTINLKSGSEKYLNIDLKSRFFRIPEMSRFDDGYIMATHTISGIHSEGSSSSNSECSTITPTSIASGFTNILEEALGSTIGQTSPFECALEDEDCHDSRSMSTDGNNKIIKDLLNEKDEEDSSTSHGDSLERIYSTSHLQASVSSGQLQEIKSLSSKNNILRELLDRNENSGIFKTDSGETLCIKEERITDSDFNIKGGYVEGLLPSVLQNVKEDKSDIEFKSPQSVGLHSADPQTSHPSSNLVLKSRTVEHSSQSLSSVRCLKRPSEDLLDGSSKHHVMGAFETLLGPSPPSGCMSPVPIHGGPPTPLGRPTTPHGGPPTPHGRPATPHGGPNTPLGGCPTPLGGRTTPVGQPLTPHAGPVTPGTPNSIGNVLPNSGGPLSSPVQGMIQSVQLTSQGKPAEKNKLLRNLLAKEPTLRQQPSQPTIKATNPHAVPQESLMKDWSPQSARSGGQGIGNRLQPEILNRLLSQPPSCGSKSAMLGISGGMHQSMSSNQQHMSHFVTSQSQLSGTSAHSSMNSQQQRSPIDTVTSCGNSFSQNNTAIAAPNHSQSLTASNIMESLSSSTNSTTTTALPSFTDTMRINPLGVVPSTSYSDGILPSITTATSSLAMHVQDSTASNDPDLENVIKDVLEMTSCKENDEGSAIGDCLSPVSPMSSRFNLNDSMAIPKIQNFLMSSEIESHGIQNQMHFSPYSSNTGMASDSSYAPPPYNAQRMHFAGHVRNSTSVAAAGGHMTGVPVMRSSNPQFSPNNLMLQQTSLTPQQQRELLLKKQRLLEQQEQQVILSSTAGDMNQPQQPYNCEEMMSPNRSLVESQSSPTYNLLNSPVAGGQISPGQRVAQPPFSPHGAMGSPIQNNQQYSNSPNLSGQISGYQVTQNSQLSPRLSQGSPAPNAYAGAGPPVPQMSPTGPNQQATGWPPSASQQRSTLQMQNPILNAQLSTLASSRNYSAAGRGQMSQLRSTQRQNSYNPMSRADGQGYPSSSPQPVMMYQQTQASGQQPVVSPQQRVQQQQQASYGRLHRMMSAPAQLGGVHSPRSTHYALHQPGGAQHHPAPHHLSGGHLLPSHHSAPMGHIQLQGAMDGPVMHMGGGSGGIPHGVMGGVMSGQGYGGDFPSHNYEVGPNYYGGPDPSRNSTGLNGGMPSESTRNTLRARVEARSTGGSEVGIGGSGNAPSSPSPIQHGGQLHGQATNCNAPHVQMQQHSPYIDAHLQQHHIDHLEQQQQSMHRSFSPSGDANKWMSDGSMNQTNRMNSSPPRGQMEEGRSNSNNNGEKGSMLQQLLSQSQ